MPVHACETVTLSVAEMTRIWFDFRGKRIQPVVVRVNGKLLPVKSVTEDGDKIIIETKDDES